MEKKKLLAISLLVVIPHAEIFIEDILIKPSRYFLMNVNFKIFCSSLVSKFILHNDNLLLSLT